VEMVIWNPSFPPLINNPKENMNVLTAKQLRTFEDAFICIMRVANASTKDATEIRIGDEYLPRQYYDLLEEIGGLQKLDHHFCPMHKEETLKWLIKRCYRDKQQPSDFIYHTTVSVKQHNYNVVEHSFN